MALKFLNKKGWHTGSLRNIENVWKAEQKHDAEQKKLEELRKQIHEERERAEFRQLQEQAGLIPRQERLDFLYESGLAVGKGSGFKELESLPKTGPETTASSSTATNQQQQQPAVPGALFEEKEKPQSANDSWRKLHSDPLLLIRQREQEALARVKNNPIQMAMIRKSVESKKDKGKEKKKHSTKHRKKSKHRKHSSPEIDSGSEDASLTVEKQRDSRHRESRSDKPSRKAPHYSDKESSEEDSRSKNQYDKEYNDRKPSNLTVEKQRDSRHRESRSDKPSRKAPRYSDKESSEEDSRRKNQYDKEYNDRKPSNLPNPKYDKIYGDQSSYESKRKEYSSVRPPRNDSNNKHRSTVKLSEEERAARLREMQMDAERHEEQRWKRLKKAADSEAREAVKDNASMGRSFLDAAHKSVYGAEKGGSSTIEESVRRRTHYLQGRSATDSNGFRR
ncbi:hypothetical protein ACJIZ3_012867 [Penstemon smallii]|uniref:CBF1-interacting co-repressor CIR N-terminal domain-containing protein n=1 Tax=Penstemon smallii TaxID=265156 RepID=A0ABD3UNL9_9LAMI